jgi:hypothetical protein
MWEVRKGTYSVHTSQKCRKQQTFNITLCLFGFSQPWPVIQVVFSPRCSVLFELITILNIHAARTLSSRFPP